MKKILLTENEFAKVSKILCEEEYHNGLIGYLYTDDLYKAVQTQYTLKDFLNHFLKYPEELYYISKDSDIREYAGLEEIDCELVFVDEEKEEKVKKDLTDIFENFKAENFKFYEDKLELSDRRLIWDLPNDVDFDKDLYEDLCNQAIEDFEEEFSEDLFILGRGNRHVCVEDCFENASKYNDMCKFIEKLQNGIVEDYKRIIKEND